MGNDQWRDKTTEWETYRANNGFYYVHDVLFQFWDEPGWRSVRDHADSCLPGNQKKKGIVPWQPRNAGHQANSEGGVGPKDSQWHTFYLLCVLIIVHTFLWPHICLFIPVCCVAHTCSSKSILLKSHKTLQECCSACIHVVVHLVVAYGFIQYFKLWPLN